MESETASVRTGAENERLAAARQGAPWKKWGPYLSERQWGTVREDYSESGDAWNFFPHEHARSRAYRWGEDGMGGFSDDRQMKYLYKYPQGAYPYLDLIKTNSKRSRNEKEYELLDTGIFDHDRYFDVFVEYAKAGPEDILLRITAANRGPEEAELHLLPTLWFRNDWAPWLASPAEKPMLKQVEGTPGAAVIEAFHAVLGRYYLHCEGNVPLLFTENDTNHAKLGLDYPDASPYLKDGINNYVVQGNREAVNPERRGTKVAAHYRLKIAPRQSATVQLRLTPAGPEPLPTPFGATFKETMATRIEEADEFYRTVTPPSVSPDAANVMRQALAGMLWSKQYYYFDAACGWRSTAPTLSITAKATAGIGNGST
jgi:hypothetical protein